MLRTKPVRSLAEYVNEACRIRDQWIGGGSFYEPWFRGVKDSSWALLPSLYRLDLAEDEEELRADFVSRGRHLLVEHEPRTEWEWYFLMQHFKAPTRLLDWTTGSLIALYFALNSYLPGSPEVHADPAVWVLDPWWLNGEVLQSKSIVLSDWPEAAASLPGLYSGRVLRRRFPIAVEPPHVARRVAVQRSRFTIHGTVRGGLELIAKRPRSRLRQIVIAKASVPRMRTDLLTCGYSETTLFPDLEGLGREVARFYTEPN